MADVKTIKVVVDGVQAKQDINGLEQNAKKMAEAYKGVGKEAKTASGALGDMAKGFAESKIKDATGQVAGFSDVLKVVRTGAGGAGLAIGAMAAMVALATKSFLDARAQIKELNNTMLVTGNYAGLTAAKFDAMQVSMGAKTGRSFADVRAAMMELAKTGSFTAAQMEAVVPSILKFSKLTGASVQEASAKFADLAREPAKAAEALDRSMNFLTASQRENITRLDQAGNKTEAYNIATKALSEQLNAQAKSLDGLAAYWQKAKDKASDYYDTFGKNVNKRFTLDGQLEIAQGVKDRLSHDDSSVVGNFLNRDTALFSQGTFDVDAARKAIDKEIADLKAKVSERDKLAADAAENSQLQRDGKNAFDFLRSYLDAGISLEDKIKNFDRNMEKARAANLKAYQLGKEAINPMIFNDAAVAKARQAFIQANRNPIDEQREKQALESQIGSLDGLVQQEGQIFQTRQAMLRAIQQQGYISLDEATKREHDLKLEDIQNEIKYTEQKLAIQKAYAASHPDDNREVKKVEEINKALSALHGQELIENAQYTAKVAEQARQLADIYDKLKLDIKKSQNERGNAMQDELNQMFMSEGEAAMARTTSSLNEKYRQMHDNVLEQYKGKGATGSSAEAEALAAVDKARQEDLAREQRFYDTKLEMQKDWKNGAVKSLKDYAENARNIAKATQEATSGILGSLEDHLTQFFATGKFGFKDFVNEINQQLSRIAARQVTGLIAEGLTGMFGGMRAEGGPVDFGKAYIVGEKEPEVFVPNTAGRIYNQSQLAAMGGSNGGQVVVHVNGVQVSGGLIQTEADLQNFAAAVGRQVKQQVLGQRGFGGALENK